MRKIVVFILILGLIFLIVKISIKPNKESAVPTDTTLPVAVEATRQAIASAAQARDFEILGTLATEPFKYSFGLQTPNGFVEHLREDDSQGAEPLETMLVLLSLPYAKQGQYYIWPDFFVKSAEEWTEEDVAEMKTYMTDEEIEGSRLYGAYIGYRIGIDETGKWTYFIAGD